MTWTAQLATWTRDPARWNRERAASMLLFLARASDEETNPVDPSKGIGPDWLIPAQLIVGTPTTRGTPVPPLARVIVADYMTQTARALDAANIAAPAYVFDVHGYDLVTVAIATKLAHPPTAPTAPAPARTPAPRPRPRPAPAARKSLPGSGPLLLACVIAGAVFLWKGNQ